MSTSVSLNKGQIKETQSMSSYENTSICSSSLISSKNERLKFLRKSPIKRARRSFINLYSYLFSALPIQSFVCKLMFGLRLLQMFIVSFFYPNETLYRKGNYSYSVGVFLSIFTRFFPIGSDIKYQMVLGYIYIAFFIIHILFLSFSAYYFEKKSTLPSFIPTLLSYVFLIIEHLPHCWIMSLIGVITSQESGNITDEQIVIVVLSSITAIIFFILHQLLNISTIFFTPSAFRTANPWPQSSMTFTISVICFLSEFSGHYSNKTVSIILMCLTVVGYCLIFCFMMFFARFLSGFQEMIFSSVTFGSIVNSIISIIYFILDKAMPEYIIIIIILIIVICLLLGSYFHTFYFIKSIQILDSLEESKENYSMFKRSSQLIPHILVGFQVNHRYCLSYSVFVDSLNVFEEDFSLLVYFAKFLAIYPEEYSQLNWVYMMVQKIEKKNIKKKYIKAQLMTILMRRESTLSNELKKKLQSISNLIVTAKLRMRNTWEAALSGSTSELEPLFLLYSSIVKQIDLKFTYLQNYHSNNQYALSALSNYEREVQANYELSSFHREKARKIKLGHSEGVDQVYLYGRVYFPNLPPRPIYHNMRPTAARPNIPTNAQVGGSSAASGSDFGSIDEGQIIDDDGFLYIQDMQTRLRNTIMNMSISSLRMSITLTLVMVALFFVIPYIVVLVLIRPMETMISDPVKYLTNLDKVHKYVLHLYGLTCHWIMEDAPLYIRNLCGNSDGSQEDVWSVDGGVPQNIGGDCHTNKMMTYFAEKALEALDELSEIKKDKSKNIILKEVKDTLFNDTTLFIVYATFNIPRGQVNKSLQQNSVDSVLNVLKIANSKHPSEYATSRQLVNLLFNSFQFETCIKDLTEKLLNYINDHSNQIKKIFYILEIALSVSFPVIFITVSIVLTNWSRSQKLKVFRCFNSLPKTTLSKMIEESNTEPLNDDNDMSIKTEKEIEYKRQEERTITVFRSGDIGSQLSQLFGILLIGILILVSDLVFINFGCQYYIKNLDDFIHSSPLLMYCSYTYCDSVSALLLLTCKAWMDNGLKQAQLTDPFILAFLLTKIQLTQDNYRIMFYGDSESQIHTVSKYIKNFEKYETSKCDFKDVNSSVYHSMYRCLSDDSMYHYYVNLIKRIFYEYSAIGRNIDLNSSVFFDVWHTLFGHLYPQYMDPLNEELTDSVQHVFTNNRSKLIIISTVLLIFGLLISFLYVYELSKQEKKLKQVLLMILHAPPQEILESSYIMAIISGDFSSRDDNDVHLDDIVYKSITENYPNGILIINNTGNILFMNSKANEYLTKFSSTMSESDKEKQKNKMKNKNTKNEMNNKNEIKIPNEIVLGQSQFSLNGRLISAKYTKLESTKTFVTLTDMSIIQKLEMDLEEETKRKKELITKVMPQNLTLKFMSNQEQGVSFSVQSVTIAMISLCLEEHNDNTIQIFNEVYNSLDSLIKAKNFQTIESIEIIGDLFMAIGGLFDEVNQTERHAQEITRFSLEALTKIKAIKEKFNCADINTLCGVAAGGPVYGGVIELDVPIFEVCGDVIDLAEEMMALGMPDVIHTTRAVYEFIYGRDFQIKERGELAVPNFGTVVTYIVSGSNE
ncbi:hypothetical protein M9Y10_009884 [Tritrichomonas musculus]|uniref:Guanylate cyclase domain-containing protein n=1 Tax=Tritrichomonas musculus TaxID=1915356 RepID=A0ABR2IPS1_9EUKA